MGRDIAFERRLRDVYDGRATFDEFARETRGRWEALARYLLRRWRVGGWASQEDVVQDLLVGAWQHVWKWSPAHKGAAGLSQYVVYNAVDRAKKQVHRYRGASRSGNADANPSHIPPSPGKLWGDDADRRVEEILSEDAPQEEHATVRERVDLAIRGAGSRRERRVLEAAVRTGHFPGLLLAEEESLAAVAREVYYGDLGVRRACRLSSMDHALRVTVEAAKAASDRLVPAGAGA